MGHPGSFSVLRLSFRVCCVLSSALTVSLVSTNTHKKLPKGAGNWSSVLTSRGKPLATLMTDQEAHASRSLRAWPSPKPPAVKAGTKKRGTSCTTDSVRLAEADNLIAGRSLGMVVLCAADVDRFRQGKGALTHPPQPTSPALKTHATFLCWRGRLAGLAS